LESKFPPEQLTLKKRLAKRDPTQQFKVIDATDQEVAEFLKNNPNEGEYDYADYIDSIIEYALSNGGIRPTLKPCTAESAGPPVAGRQIKRVRPKGRSEHKEA
jgi:hypothetical protein